jgi:hypothetical protein
MSEKEIGKQPAPTNRENNCWDSFWNECQKDYREANKFVHKPSGEAIIAGAGIAVAGVCLIVTKGRAENFAKIAERGMEFLGDCKGGLARAFEFLKPASKEAQLRAAIEKSPMLHAADLPPASTRAFKDLVSAADPRGGFGRGVEVKGELGRPPTVIDLGGAERSKVPLFRAPREITNARTPAERIAAEIFYNKQLEAKDVGAIEILLGFDFKADKITRFDVEAVQSLLREQRTEQTLTRQLIIKRKMQINEANIYKALR